MTLIVEDFYGELLAIAEQIKNSAARSESRECGANAEGGGGFQPGNTCGKGDGGGGGGSAAPTPKHSAWRQANAESLEKFRSSIAASKKLADDLVADQESRRQAAYEAKEKAREENDSIKEKLQPARLKLRDALIASAASQEEKDRWQKENLILLDKNIRPKDLEGKPGVTAAVNELKALQARREQILGAMLGHDIEMEAATQAAKAFQRDAAKDAWRQIGDRARQFAADDGDNGLNYKPELYDSDVARFAESLKSSEVTVKSGDRMEFDAVKRDVDEFISTAISPVSQAGLAVTQAQVVIDKKNERAFASGKELNLHPSGNATTYSHELGHVLETQPAIKQAAIEFHAARCDPNDEVSLREKYPDSGYHPAERGNPDRFAKAIEAVYRGDDPYGLRDYELSAHYVGKVYRDAGSNVKATEIVSMGLQMMHDNPAAFAEADPEYFDFMVGIMTGESTRFRQKRAK